MACSILPSNSGPEPRIPGTRLPLSRPLVVLGAPLTTSFLIFKDGSLLRVYIKNSQTAGPIGSLENGDWHHIAVTRSGTLVKMYFDGGEIVSVTKSGAAMDIAATGLVLGQGTGLG